MSAISSSEVVSVVRGESRQFKPDNGAYIEHGLKTHKRIQGELLRTFGTFRSFEGQSLVPRDLCDGVETEPECVGMIGEGVSLKARLDAVMGDGTVCLEIKPGSKDDARYYWLQLILNSTVWMLDRHVGAIKKMFMYFYNTDNLYTLDGLPNEDVSASAYIAIAACQIRDRQNYIDSLEESFDTKNYRGDQKKLIISKKGEAAEAEEYVEHLQVENIRQRRAMEPIFQQLVVGIVPKIKLVEKEGK